MKTIISPVVHVTVRDSIFQRTGRTLFENVLISNDRKMADICVARS